MGSRRWAEMIPVLKQKYDIYVFTTNSTGDLKVDLPESNIERVGYVSNLLFKKQVQKPSFAHKLFSTFTNKMRTIDSTFVFWYLKYRKHFLQYVKNIKPELLITTSVSIAPAMFGYYCKKKIPKIIWVNDLRDSMSIYNKHEKNFLQHFIDKLVDKSIMKKADHLFTVSNTLSNILSEYYKKDITTIYNGFKHKQIESEATYNRIPQLYYAGRIYPHREPAFMMLLDVIKEKKLSLKLRLLGNSDQFDRYLNLIKEKNLKNIEILDPAPAETVQTESKKADVLLIFEELRQIDEVSKGTLTGKLFEYLPYPGAILAICRPDSEIGEILQRTKRGRLASNKKQISAFIDHYRKYLGFSWDLIYPYSREQQAKKVVETLQKLNK
jgi:hypothetical protein